MLRVGIAREYRAWMIYRDHFRNLRCVNIDVHDYRVLFTGCTAECLVAGPRFRDLDVS